MLRDFGSSSSVAILRIGCSRGPRKPATSRRWTRLTRHRYASTRGRGLRPGFCAGGPGEGPAVAMRAASLIAVPYGPVDVAALGLTGRR